MCKDFTMMVSGMKPQYGDKIRMAFTGTDSFVFHTKLMIYIYMSQDLKEINDIVDFSA